MKKNSMKIKGNSQRNFQWKINEN